MKNKFFFQRVTILTTSSAHFSEIQFPRDILMKQYDRVISRASIGLPEPEAANHLPEASLISCSI